MDQEFGSVRNLTDTSSTTLTLLEAVPGLIPITKCWKVIDTPYHGHLTVDGDTYTWGSAAEKESGTRWRTLNLFSGRDHIVYRVQFSTDEGKTWTTTKEGKEARVSQ